MLSRTIRRLTALRGCLAQDLVRPVLLLTAQRAPEIAQPTPKRPPDLGKLLGAKHQQSDHEDEQKVRWLKDVADHAGQLSRSGGRAGRELLRYDARVMA